MKKILSIMAIIITLLIITTFTTSSLQGKKQYKSETDNIKHKVVLKINKINAEVKIPVLMYHNVDDSYMDDYVISIKDFTDQMQYLKDNNYTPIGLDNYNDLIHENYSNVFNSGGKYVLITFDDARISQWNNALPILKKFKFKATFFVPTGLLNTETFMSNAQITQLSKLGFDVANHTVEHEWLTDFSYKEQLNIIKNSNSKLRQLTGKNVKYISYPYGQYNVDTVSVLNELNMNLGFCSDGGISSSEYNPLVEKRQFIYGGITINDFGLLLK